MSITLSFLGYVAPEYVSLDAARFAILLPIAEEFIDDTLWGDKADYGVAMILAHMVKVSERNGKGGAVSSEKIGNYAVTYADNLQHDSELGSTSYGQEYLRVRKSLPITPFVAT